MEYPSREDLHGIGGGCRGRNLLLVALAASDGLAARLSSQILVGLARNALHLLVGATSTAVANRAATDTSAGGARTANAVIASSDRQAAAGASTAIVAQSTLFARTLPSGIRIRTSRATGAGLLTVEKEEKKTTRTVFWNPFRVQPIGLQQR